MQLLQKMQKFGILNCSKLFLEKIYDCLCGYGRFIVKPFLILLSLIFICFFSYYFSSPCIDLWVSSQAAVIGAIPLFPVAHFDDNALQEVLKESSFGAVYYVVIVQQILSSILLFLIGLGLRNRFRI